MIEEPYRWVEAIANRREYIETQLSSGSPIVALSYAGGILLLTVGRQKLFEIYDRIALGAIGHPGDIETGEVPTREQLGDLRKQHLKDGVIEAAVLDREIKSAVRYHALNATELTKLTAS